MSDEEIRELRRKFGDDVPITETLPSPEEVVRQESWLERIVGTVGLEKWMWKSRRGLLIAIIVVPPGVTGLVDFWSPPITAAYEYARPYIGVIEHTGLEFRERLIAFLPEPAKGEQQPLAERAILAPTVGQLITASQGRVEVDTTVYRLIHRRIDPLDGDGAMKYGGRWNSPGPRLLYTSDSVLAAVEELKRHIPGHTLPPFVLHEINVAGAAEVLPPSAFELVMNDDLEATRRIGDEWIRRAGTGLMIAPSRVDPASHSVLINLARSKELELRIVRSTPIGMMQT